MRRSTDWCLGSVVLVTLVCAGCRNPEKPRYRLGCLPFPGLFTLHDLADPDDLGTHRYEQALPLLSGEEDRGILYTCRAGFLDLAHVRDSVDRTKYFFERIEPAILDAQPSITIKMAEPDKFVLSFNYPPDWLTVPTSEREILARELALLLAEEMTWISTTWHEIITFYGYKSAVIIPEAQSAFTYDDIVAHIVGMEVATMALRNDGVDFNRAATIALRDRLAELGVVDVRQCGDAIKAVEGLWWEDGDSFKRQPDIGFDDRVIEPWVVPDFAPCGDVGAEPMALPRFDNVRGRDFRGFMDVEVAPNFFEWDSVRRLLPGDPPPERVRPYEHFPIILDDIRTKLLQALGQNFDTPDLPNMKVDGP
jgi:hypothetical protein